MRSVISALILIGASASAATDETSHKLFAGTFTNPSMLKELIVSGDKMTRSSETVIPCQAGTQFGAAYMLEISTKQQKASREQVFTETWTYPESFEQSATIASREVAGHFKRQRSNPMFSGSVITEGVGEESEFHLEVSQDGKTYLEHTFKVMGCSDDTIDDLEQALAMGDADQLICTMEKSIGSRIKKRVCRTQAELEMNRSLMETELKHSSR